MSLFRKINVRNIGQLVSLTVGTILRGLCMGVPAAAAMTATAVGAAAVGATAVGAWFAPPSVPVDLREDDSCENKDDIYAKRKS